MRNKVQVWIAHQNRVLVLKTQAGRMLEDPTASFWQPVTGGVEEGESLAEAALREATEETGLEFTAPPLALGFEFEFDSRWGPSKETAFALEAAREEPVRLDPTEHCEYRWVSSEVATEMLRFQNNREALWLLAANWAAKKG